MITRFGIAAIGTKTRRSVAYSAEQPAVAGMHAGRDRRLVMRQLLIIGQVAAEMPDRQPDEDAAGDDSQQHADEKESDQLDHVARTRAGSPCFGAAAHLMRQPRG